jgi:hypothetical protein
MQLCELKNKQPIIFLKAATGMKPRSVLEEMDIYISSGQKFKDLFEENQEFGFDWPLQDFFRRIHTLLNNSEYGTRIQNKVCNNLLGLKKPKGKVKKGDGISISGKLLEFKVSFKSKNAYAFLQVRPWDKFGHIFLAIDPEDNYNYTIFFLTAAHIENELNKMGGTCHGNTDLKAVRLYTTGKNKPTYDRYVEKYKIESFERLAEIINK